MFQEHRFGNISFKEAIGPAGHTKAKLNIGGIALTLRQSTWNDLVSLAEEVGKIETKETKEEKEENETIEHSTDVEVEEKTEENEVDSELMS